jgi:hypothetical protein
VSTKVWRFDIWQGLERIESFELPAHRFTESGIKEFLRALATKAQNLTYEEIASSYVNRRKGGPEREHLLEVDYEAIVEKRCSVYSCGHNPWVTATISWD